MNSRARYKPSKDSNPDCADLITMAERELSAFFNAVTQLLGSEQAELSAEDWLHELIEIDGLPAFSPRMEIDHCESLGAAPKWNTISNTPRTPSLGTAGE